MSSGYISILTFELFLPTSHSLKEKRMVLRSVKQQLSNRLGCSIAEVDHHDTWQRARVTLSCVAREAAEAERLIDDAERWLLAQDYAIVASERATVTLDDAS